MKQQLGHYDIVSELGRGGMGVVYKGFEASLHRYVAIKVLADSLAHDEAVKERFLREARSMAALNDPHIIQIYFIGDDDGQTFFVMEFVDGESLGSILKREGLLHPDQAARIILQTAQGLATAHDRGVIHRDIKPGNMMITSRGNVKIADFGIALSTSDFSKKLTSTGEFVGTPGYLSPEVCLGKPVDQRSDIFSLGIVLFEMLAGRMPFTDESPLGLMLEVVKAEIPDVCTLNAEVDPELSRILSRMIAKDPNDRYQNCQELINDLSRHPLLASGGTLRLQTQPSPAAATVIGMKTPLSGQVPLPRTTPTASTIQRSTPASNTTLAAAESAPITARSLPTPVPASAPAAHESVLQRQVASAPKKSSAALPLAIAAIVLLGLGGGAWAFREQIPMLKQWLPGAQIVATPNSSPSTTTASVASQATTASSTNSTSAVSAPGSSATTSAQANAGGTAPSASTASSASANSVAATVAAAPSTASAVAPANETASVAELIAASTPAAVPVPVAAPPAAPASTAASPAPIPPALERALVDQVAKAYTATGPAPRASQVDALKELAAAQAASAGEVARSTPLPPVVPAKPHIPTIAVLSGGDISVADPAGRMIEHALSHNGYRMMDAEMMPQAERFLSGQRPNVAGLLDMLARSGRVDAIVVVHARPVGSQNIAYHGQSDTMNTAQLNVSVYVVQGQHKLGQSWTENVNFTALSAKSQAEEAVQEIAPQVEQVLVDYRPGRNRG